MLEKLILVKRKLLFLSALGVLSALQGSVAAQKVACGTCWEEKPKMTCIIDGVKVEEACDASTPGCTKTE